VAVQAVRGEISQVSGGGFPQFAARISPTENPSPIKNVRPSKESLIIFFEKNFSNKFLIFFILF
jgi:hypothetical protein